MQPSRDRAQSDRAKRVLIATGGTGGHLFPALALAHDLLQDLPGIQICLAGGGLEDSPFLELEPQGGWSVVPITAPKPNLWQPWSVCGKMLRGVRESYELLEEFNPDLLVGFGSFHTFPLLMAARQTATPYMLHEGNAIPGRVNRMFAKGAECTAVHFSEASQRLKGETRVVAMPLRSVFSHSKIPQSLARQELGLDPEKFTILVIGGSQGAKALNEILLGAAPALLSTGECQVIHLVGPRRQSDAEKLIEAYGQAKIQAVVKTFEPRMDLVWNASDLTIARSGASCLAEQLAVGVPGILVPFPGATDNHQHHNASTFARESGGAIVAPQHLLTPQYLVKFIRLLRSDGGQRLQAMKQAMSCYRACNALQRLSGLVHHMAGWSS